MAFHRTSARWVCHPLVLTSLALAAAWLLLPRSYEVHAAPPDDRAPAVAVAEGRILGVSSCASMACHHANGPRGTKLSEYTTWIGSDLHAKAYVVLLDQRSKIIERNFRRLKSVADARPEEDALCLKCHGPTADLPGGGQGAAGELVGLAGEDRIPPVGRGTFAHMDGVGCESCHGPAERWITEHYKLGWKSLPTEAKAALGYKDLRDLTTQANMCVKCHVGAGLDQEVNHDLIAAGHPRLNFEFGAYLANMPPHWDIREERARWAQAHPGEAKDARAWIIGQVISAKAAVELTQARAQAASADKAPWPEFAEYDCFACHHDLEPKPWRQARGYKGRTPGAPPWGNWYVSMLDTLGKQRVTAAPDTLPTTLESFAKLMNRPRPSPKDVSTRAAQLAAELDAWRKVIERGRYDDGAVRTLLSDLRKEDRSPAESWDVAAQRYLALAAMHVGLVRTQPDPELRAYLKERSKALGFRKNYDSPKGFDPGAGFRKAD